jgi:hypothetical protein
MTTSVAHAPTGFLRINDSADFTAETTEGKLDFHVWIGKGWRSCSRIQKILRRSVRPSSGIWQA